MPSAKDDEERDLITILITQLPATTQFKSGSLFEIKDTTRQHDYNPDLPYTWRGSTVAKILRTLEYGGHLVNLRTMTKDFKRRKSELRPQDE